MYHDGDTDVTKKPSRTWTQSFRVNIIENFVVPVRLHVSTNLSEMTEIHSKIKKSHLGWGQLYCAFGSNSWIRTPAWGKIAS